MVNEEIIDIARALIEYGRHHYNSICRFNHHVEISQRGKISIDGENYSGTDPEFIRAAKFLYYRGYTIQYIMNHPTLITPDGEVTGMVLEDVERMM